MKKLLFPALVLAALLSACATTDTASKQALLRAAGEGQTAPVRTFLD